MAELKKQKVALTELLRNTIKSLRLTYKKNGVALSKELEKGASYISQIESGKIQDIEYDMIHTIFQQITNLSNNEYVDFIKGYILDLIKTLSKEEYFNELWIHVFVMQDMPVNIPDSLIELIKEKLETCSCNLPKEFIEVLNNNERFGDGKHRNRKYLENKLSLAITKYPNKDKYIYSETIYYNLPLNYLELILDKKITYTSYIYMKGILLNLYINQPEGINRFELSEIYKTLVQYNFFKSMELYDYLNNGTDEENASHSPYTEKTTINNYTFLYDDAFSTIHEKYKDLKIDAIEKISNVFERYKNENLSYACDILEKIIRNLDSDPLLLVSILYSDLCEVDVSSKLTFWDEYKKLVQRFSKDNTDS